MVLAVILHKSEYFRTHIELSGLKSFLDLNTLGYNYKTTAGQLLLPITNSTPPIMFLASTDEYIYFLIKIVTP